MSEFSRYPSLIKHNNLHYLCINQKDRHNGVSEIMILDENYNKIKSLDVEEATCIILLIILLKFKSKDQTTFYGIGGND